MVDYGQWTNGKLNEVCVEFGHTLVVLKVADRYIILYCHECSKVWRVKTHGQKGYIDATSWYGDLPSEVNVVYPDK